MSKRIFTLLLILPLLCSTTMTVAAKEKTKGSRWGYYNEYSRWSLGANIGFPFFAGDFKSFSEDKTYWGVTSGLQLGYQLTPTWGLSLSAAYAQNKAGAKGYELDYMLGPNGYSYYGQTLPEGYAYYKDLYSEIKMFNFGLNVDINVLNLFWPAQNSSRRWAVLASPGVYLQKFSPRVYNKADDKRFTTTNLDNSVNFGLGGDLAVRFKASRTIDIQLKGGMIWIDNNKFDGIETVCNRKYNTMVTTTLGVVWKIGGQKNDHLMYASPYAPVSYPDPEPVKEVVKTVRDTVVVVRVEPAPEVEVKEMPVLPSVHFTRGSADLDAQENATDLAEILVILKEYPDVKFRILGFADHTGTEQINAKISQDRANALKSYLVYKGISSSRIIEAKGMGKDVSLQGEAAFSVKARRAEVIK